MLARIVSKYKRKIGRELSEKLLRTGPGFYWALRRDSLLPFTVTNSVTSRELSIAVESRDANLVFGEDLIGSSNDVSFYVP